MITLLNRDSLYNLFGVKDFNSLENSIDNMAPSLVEYHLSSLCEPNFESYLNKRDVEKSISIGEYEIYIDYNEDIYLEINIVEDDSQTLW